jgi:hypothetical protein
MDREPHIASEGLVNAGQAQVSSQSNQKITETSKSTLVGTIVFCVSFNLLRGFGWSRPGALMISSILLSLIDYWIPPRPSVPFHRHALFSVLISFALIASFWTIPALLRNLIPLEFAYAIPAFFCAVAFYAAPMLRSGKRWHSEKTGQEIGFGKWVIGCAVFSLVVGGIVKIFHVGS